MKKELGSTDWDGFGRWVSIYKYWLGMIVEKFLYRSTKAYNMPERIMFVILVKTCYVHLKTIRDRTPIPMVVYTERKWVAYKSGVLKLTNRKKGNFIEY